MQASREQLVDELLVASRALVGVAAQSLAEADDVTLPQFRALVLLGHQETTTTSELADGLAVHQSTATRLVDRLVRNGWVRRQAVATDRRQVALVLTPAGSRLVTKVLERRRRAIAAIVDDMRVADVRAAAGALAAFATAAGEPAALEL